MRVPFVMEWPNVMRRRHGHEYTAPTGHVDVLPTFCAAAGIPLRADRVIDGQNLLRAIPEVLVDMQHRLTAFDTALKADRAKRYGA